MQRSGRLTQCAGRLQVRAARASSTRLTKTQFLKLIAGCSAGRLAHEAREPRLSRRSGQLHDPVSTTATPQKPLGMPRQTCPSEPFPRLSRRGGHPGPKLSTYRGGSKAGPVEDSSEPPPGLSKTSSLRRCLPSEESAGPAARRPSWIRVLRGVAAAPVPGKDL